MIDYRDNVRECSKKIAAKKLSIAFAESATAGKLAYEFALCEESGDILKGGIVCYDACVKEDILGVSKATVEQFTPESAEVTRAMCLGLGKIMNADITVAVTGLTSAGGSESPEKPVGTMFYCILFKGSVIDQRIVMDDEPEEVINETINAICTCILTLL